MGQLQNGQQLLMPTRAHTSSCSRPDTTTNVYKSSPLAPVLSQIHKNTQLLPVRPDTTSPHLIYIIISFNFTKNTGTTRLY